MTKTDQEKARKVFKYTVDARVCYKKFEGILRKLYELAPSEAYELRNELIGSGGK